jgi:hypothetical protein
MGVFIRIHILPAREHKYYILRALKYSYVTDYSLLGYEWIIALIMEEVRASETSVYFSGIQPGVRVPPGVREDILGGT